MRSENNKLKLFLLGAILFGVYCFVFGQSGILERMRLEKEKETLAHEIKSLERENGRLESLYDKYARGELSSLECENAGFIFPGNKFLFFNHSREKGRDIVIHPTISKNTFFKIDRLRIGWVLFSVLVMLLYFGFLHYKRRDAMTVISRGEDI
ncbi:MAG TPA: hypothetical protein VF857_00360 [Spirochaetota bacterium]